jgi:hypothetical protein
VVGGKAIDIETEPHPIAVAFDMGDLAPSGAPSKAITTPMGKIGMGHVLTGIDTVINGFPTAAAAGATSGDAALKYKTLAAATAGDPRDFATWSGDLGQAYGDYLVAKYIKGTASASLAGFSAAVADPAALTADIHGYIATQVWTDIARRGQPDRLCQVGVGHPQEPVPGPQDRDHRADLPPVFREGLRQDRCRSRRVHARSHHRLRPALVRQEDSRLARRLAQPGRWTKSGILSNALDEFDKYHKVNEASAGAADRVAATVTELNRMLAGSVK